jgi:predicted nucleic acid-binding protein
VVLVDTSIWIRFLAGKEPFASELDRLLSEDEVLAHDLVYGELLIGDRGPREKWLVAYAELHRAAQVTHAEVVRLVIERKLKGVGIGWIDVHLLASALVSRASLWTADSPLTRAADSVGVAYAGLS